MTTGRINQVTIVSPKGLGQAFLQNRRAEMFVTGMVQANKNKFLFPSTPAAALTAQAEKSHKLTSAIPF
jgi:hypothetical protein